MTSSRKQEIVDRLMKMKPSESFQVANSAERTFVNQAVLFGGYFRQIKSKISTTVQKNGKGYNVYCGL